MTDTRIRQGGGSPTKANVVQVESDSSDASWTIKVTREAWILDNLPNPIDVPADVRAALTAWLRTAEEATRG